MVRERELRLALICYGGVSLAVYMHGVTKEFWKLLRASESRKCGRVPTGDTESVWRAMLEEIAAATDLVVICDILAGASAGGINSVLLANAIAQGQDLEPVTDMWLEKADVDHMLDPDARPDSRTSLWLAQLYKAPVAWMAARQSNSLATVDVPEVRAEIALKLTRFVRSRWFKPPFSGAALTQMLDSALDAMTAAPSAPPLVPPTLPLDLFVTVTDYWGVQAVLPIHSPPQVVEREHRRLFAFTSPAITHYHQAGHHAAVAHRAPVADRGTLLLAARATASFPGAFPPATVTEIDRHMARRGEAWTDREAFLARQLASDRPVEDIALIDGSVLDNAPFGPAIAMVRTRAAHREVDRRFVYVDPKPGVGATTALNQREPGFLTAIFRSLADIPRAQPIRDSLDSIAQLSDRVRRVRDVTDAMTPDVDAAMVRAVGRRFFLMKATPERLARARSRIQSQAAREAGFAFAVYAQLKLSGVLDEAAAGFAAAVGAGRQQAALIREQLAAAAAIRGAFEHGEAIGRDPDGCAYVRFLKQLDTGFRVRRLRFFIRRLAAASAASDDPLERQSCDRLQATLYLAVAPFETRRTNFAADDALALAGAARALLDASDAGLQIAAGAAALDLLAAVLGLPALDAETDRILVDAVRDPGFSTPLRRTLVRAWLGFPFYDIAILPLVDGSGSDSFEELKVDRISPDDATALRHGGAQAMLKGWQLNAFAAFFSRAYRENDYLWGRLNAAERLVDIVASAAPEAKLDTRLWKSRMIRAILAAEQPRLPKVAPLLMEITEELAAWDRAIASQAGA